MKLTLYGILWMVLFTFIDAVVLNGTRLLGAGVHPFQTLCIGNGIAGIILLGLALKQQTGMRSQNWRLHSLRIFIEFIGGSLIFAALVQIPTSQVKAILFLIPIFASIVAVYFLREKSSPAKWLSLFLGFVGMLLILQPGKEVIHPAALMTLAAAVLYSGAIVLVRVLSTREPTLRVGVNFTLGTGIFGLPFALAFWQPLDEKAWMLLVFLGVTFALGQIAVTKAFSEAPVVVIAPFMFLGLIFVSLLAFIMFDEIPRGSVYVGALVILAASGYTTYRESRK